MPKLRKPRRADIFGRYSRYVELKYMTKGRAKRKLRSAGCGPIVESPTFGELVQADSMRDVYGRAFYTAGRGWAVHITKK